MSGRLIAVVGASGVGKDSVIDALLRARPGLRRVRRTVTRPAGPGEAFDSVTPEAFAALRDAGAFCLWWDAHGLSYGLPADLPARVAAGEEAVANLSRGALAEAGTVVGPTVVLHLTARPETLARRLGGRGREDAAAIRGRLARAGDGLPEGLAAPVVTLANDGPLEETVTAALSALYGAAVP